MDVAIYLRKSRDEVGNDDVLSKHRDTLTTICKVKNWKYTLYEEIASGERIAYRPIMQQLIDDVESGKYEAVLVMDIDRLGRGSNSDWGVIYESFCNESSNTLIVTPQRTYDLTEDTDEMMVDIQSLFAKMEYKAIKKRMLRGKIAGAKQGKWVCGNPPYPYIKINGKLEVDQDKLKVYQKILDLAYNGTSLEQIELYLNTNKIKMPSGVIPEGKNRGWDYTQIKRILVDETHLGYIVYGKTKGDPRKGNHQRVSRDHWIIAHGDHEQLKTQEEHDKIVALIESRRCIPSAAKAGKQILSGLLFCKECGHSMRFTTTRGKYKCTQCRHKYADGTVCQQRGSTLADPFVPNIIASIFEFDESRITELRKTNEANDTIQKDIANHTKTIEKCNSAITRLYELYEDSCITKDEFATRKAIKDKQKNDLLSLVDSLRKSITPVESEKDFRRNLQLLKTNWSKCVTDTEKNTLLHSVIKKIVYSRKGTDPATLEVYYK